MSPRHRDSPRVRRLARAAGVDLAGVRPSGPHGRATALDLTRAAAPAPPSSPAEAVPEVPAQAGPSAAGVGAPSAAHVPASSSLLEVDVTAFLRDAAAGATGPPRTRLLAAVAGSLARAAAATRAAGLPAGPVAVRVTDDDGHVATLDEADLLSLDGLLARTARASAPGPAEQATSVSSDRPGPVLDVVGTAGSGTTVDLRPARPGALLLLCVGPVVRRPVVVLGADGEEQIGVRSVAWFALTGTGPGADEVARLLVRVGQDLTRPVGAGR